MEALCGVFEATASLGFRFCFRGIGDLDSLFVDGEEDVAPVERQTHLEPAAHDRSSTWYATSVPDIA
eukprot:1498401-Rhodomonas_salina.1